MTLILLVVVLTVVGVLLYANLTAQDLIQHEIDSLYSVHDPQFFRTMGHLLGPPIVDGNRIDVLENGDEIFPPMLEAIRNAEHTITFETYVYWSGEVATEFSNALARKAREGVRVHVLLDWVGSAKMDQKLLDEMEDAGAQVERYQKPSWYNLDRFNNRTHRKILVVDGKVGFTGGVGIADEWLGDAENPDHWRDTQVRVEGPAVAQLQAAFMDNWLQSRAEVLHGEDYFPPQKAEGSALAQVFMSSSDGGSESVRLMYLLSIAAAQKSIKIGNAYFVPDSLAVEMLLAARERGVEVQLILPGHNIDSDLTRNASRARWGPLLEAGVEIYEYQPTMYHCKIMVVDDAWVSVGSTNFDNRSFRLNDEANLNAFDSELAALLTDHFVADLTKSKRITLAQWQNRPLKEKMMEHLSSLFGSQL